MQIFGFEIKRKDSSEKMASVVTPSSDDGSTVVNSAAAYYGMVMDVEGVVKNENDLIRRYREIAQYADTDSAIDDIVNETLVSEEDCVELDLEKVKLSASIKDKIQEEFKEVLRLLKFSERGHDIFRSWYIDGRVYYHILLDENNIKQGIVELRYVDPRKIRRIKNIKKERTPKGVDVIKEIDEYYLYNDKGITEQTTQGVKLSIDSIVYAPSGMLDANTGMMLSHLHKAIKPVNQLKMIEDASVIYRISRAPERRVFYVDVGNLPKLKAEEYVNQIMNKFRNKVVYDATTGEVRDDRKHLSMMEDFWMPRRDVKRLRNRFSILFLEALRVQLIVKGIIRADEWDNMREGFRFVYDNDNHFSELKDNEILLQRITMLQQLDPYVGRYYSSDWVRKNVLQQSEEDIKNMDKQMQDDLVNQMHKADFDGTVSGITQTAQQTYLKQFAPQDTEEAAPPQSPQKTQKENK